MHTYIQYAKKHTYTRINNPKQLQHHPIQTKSAKIHACIQAYAHTCMHRNVHAYKHINKYIHKHIWSTSTCCSTILFRPRHRALCQDSWFSYHAIQARFYAGSRPANRRLKNIVLVLFNKFQRSSVSLTRNRGKCAEQLGIVQNKSSRGIVAHARRCAQTNSSAPKRYEGFLHFTKACVLGLCQDPSPRTKMVERRVVGAGYKTVGQWSQELGTPTF